MEKTLKILMLEDSIIDAEIIQQFLLKAKPNCEFKLVMTEEAYLEALDQYGPDLILSDNTLPQFSATEALKIFNQRSLSIPFILVTGTVSEEFAAGIIKLGADDYILKDRLVRLPAAIDAALKQRRFENEKLEAQRNLTQSEEKYRTLFFQSPLPKWIYDHDTLRFLDVNEAAIQLYGYSREEFLNMTIKDIRPEEDIELLLNDVKKVVAGAETRRGQWRHRKKNGELIIVETMAHSFDYLNRKTRMVVAIDITEKIKAEQDLRESEIKLKEAQAIAHVGNWEIDLAHDIHSWSDELYRIYGLEKTEVKPSIELFLSFIHPDDAAMAQSLVREALQNFKDSKIDFRFILKDGKKRYGHIEWRFESDKKGKPVRLFGIMQDITEQKEGEENLKMLEKKISEQKIQEQKKIARAMIKAQEEEKNRIGQELHDNITQILAGTKMYLSSAGKKNEELKELIKYPLQLIDSSIEELRLLSRKQVTPLKNIDLEELVRELLSNLDQHATPRMNFSYAVSGEFHSDDLKLSMYRIIQEQINNILKHAEAKNVNISIKTQGKAIIINIVDDGRGFDISNKRKGIGISNIMNRVETFNGEVEIESSPGNGCKLMVSIPC
jgi:PAS domain S-box-containing protein